MKQMDTTMKKISGVKFYIKPFSAFTSARISGDLAKVHGPLLGSISPMLKGTSSENTNIMDMDMGEMMPILGDMLTQLDGEKLEQLMKELLVDYKNITFEDEDGEVSYLTYDDANEIFCGEIMDMLMLCWEVIKLNFSGFFTKLLGQSGNLQDITDQAVKMTKTAKSGTKNTEN